MFLIKKIETNIRYKFSLIFIILITIFAVLCSGIYISNFTMQSSKNYYDSSYAILSGINSRFEDYIQQIDVYASFILYPDLTEKQSKEMEDIMKRIDFVFNDNKNIESIFHYSTQENRLIIKSSSGNVTYENCNEVQNTSWYRAGVMSDSEMYIQPQHKHVLMGELKEINNDSEVFSFIKSYTDLSGKRTILCINIYERYMKDICANSLTQQTEKLYCLNKYGEVIYSTDNEVSLYDRNYIYEYIKNSENNAGHFSYMGPKDKKQKAVVYIMADDNSNMIYKCVEKRDLNANLIQGLGMLFVLLFLIMIIMIIIILYLIQSLTKPINDLKNCLDEFSLGNLNVRIKSVREDEFKDISNSFNQMAYRINQLITEKYELELYNREAQLYSLMAQINPHFINNVLQSIGSVALERGMKDVYKSITILAKMLRYSIKEDSVVILEKELQNLKDYIYIQKFRFEEKLVVNVEIQDKLDDCLLPKLTFQPLVENSIVHGFKAKGSTGNIDIYISDSGSKLLEVRIKDDGCGITKEIMNEIKDGFADDNYKIEKKHIGLCNVYRRLKYLYGNRFRMEIKSVVGKGTEIGFSIDRSGDDVQGNYSG